MQWIVAFYSYFTVDYFYRQLSLFPRQWKISSVLYAVSAYKFSVCRPRVHVIYASSVHVLYVCRPYVSTCMFSVCLLSMSVFCAFRLCFLLCAVCACVFSVYHLCVLIFCVPSVRAYFLCAFCLCCGCVPLCVHVFCRVLINLSLP